MAAQTATFQLLASILAPFVVIHTSVDLAKKALKSAPAALARHGPTAIGLACIPLLPLVDHPIEHGAARRAARRGKLATDAWPGVRSGRLCVCERVAARRRRCGRGAQEARVMQLHLCVDLDLLPPALASLLTCALTQ